MRVSGAWNWIVSLRVLSNERTLDYVSRAPRPTARELRIYPRIDNLSILARDIIVRTPFYGQKTRRRKVCWSPRTPYGWWSQRVVHLQMRELISSHVVKISGFLGQFPLYPCLGCGGSCGRLWVLVGCRDVAVAWSHENMWAKSMGHLVHGPTPFMVFPHQNTPEHHF